jgi:glutamate synthase domain-containing protein 2
MPESSLNAVSTTGTHTRVPDICYSSGMCPICIKECRVLCEIGKAAFRGREVLYPIPEQFGTSTQGSNKRYVVDWADLQIMSNLTGARGIEADSDKAVFPDVDISSTVGGIPVKLPVYVGALGSTEIARVHWDGLAIGAAISGTIMTIGENVAGMDPHSTFANGKVTHSDDLTRRVETYRRFWDGQHGDIVVQTNVEDQRLGVDEYALSTLEVDVIERKWGQGAKSIGGEVRLTSLERARQLKQRGYIVIPDPEDPTVQAAFQGGTFRSFERHSRVGMVREAAFLEDIDQLRQHGAKAVFLKTGAYQPEAVAYTMRLASKAKIDAVTFDGAGGGTGMSPVPMMQESGVPTVFLASQVLECACLLGAHNRHVPELVLGGGFINETQVFKAIALSNIDGDPLVKAVEMARAPCTAVMKATYYAELAQKGELPRAFATDYGTDPDQFFVCSTELKNRYGARYAEIPPGAIGLYSYLTDRVATGLRQLMAGARVWRLHLLNRANVAALTERVAKVTGIPLLEDRSKDAFAGILLG